MHMIDSKTFAFGGDLKEDKEGKNKPFCLRTNVLTHVSAQQADA